MKLTIIDWIIRLVYFVFVLGVGFALKRHMKTIKDFFLSDRSLMLLLGRRAMRARDHDSEDEV